MAKFVIKESSIKEEVNLKVLNLISAELKKFVIELNFNMVMRQGNYAYWESQTFNSENFHLGVDVDKLSLYISNTLNFRYENFTVSYTK